MSNIVLTCGHTFQTLFRVLPGTLHCSKGKQDERHWMALDGLTFFVWYRTMTSPFLLIASLTMCSHPSSSWEPGGPLYYILSFSFYLSPLWVMQGFFHVYIHAHTPTFMFSLLSVSPAWLCASATMPGARRWGHSPQETWRPDWILTIPTTIQWREDKQTSRTISQCTASVPLLCQPHLHAHSNQSACKQTFFPPLGSILAWLLACRHVYLKSLIHLHTHTCAPANFCPLLYTELCSSLSPAAFFHPLSCFSILHPNPFVHEVI